MSEKKTNSEDDFRKRTKREMVDLMIDQIDNIIAKDEESEKYEECAELLVTKSNLQEFLNGNKKYEEIEEELNDVKQKVLQIMPDALKSNRKNP